MLKLSNFNLFTVYKKKSGLFLEFLGKICFYRIRPPFFFLLTLFPLILTSFYLFFQNLELSNLEESFNLSLEKGKSALERKSEQEDFLKRYRQSDPYFLDQQVESLLLLKKEQEELRMWMEHPAVVRRDKLEERLHFLLSDANRIAFTEQNVRSSQHVKETEEKQRHSVEIDETDLQKLLALIEDIPVGQCLPAEAPPQLIIQNFHLHRRKTPIDTHVFLMEMALIKREFSQ